VTERRWMSERSDGLWHIIVGYCDERRVLYSMTSGLRRAWLPELYQIHPNIVPSGKFDIVRRGTMMLLAIVSETMAAQAPSGGLEVDILHEAQYMESGASVTFCLREVSPLERPWFAPPGVPMRRVDVPDLNRDVATMVRAVSKAQGHGNVQDT
jgi:hypothetical protein